MSLEQHSIDQGYRARLEKLEVNPPLHAWMAIAARLPNEKADEKGIWWWGSGAASTKTPEEKAKRERIVFWWWTGALVALTALSLLVYYGYSSTGANKNPTPKPQPAGLAPIAASSETNQLEFTKSESSTFEAVAAIETTSVSSTSATTSSSTKSKSTESVRSTPPNLGGLSLVTPTQTVEVRLPIVEQSTSKSTNGGLLLPDTKTAALPPAESTVGLTMETLNMLELPGNDLAAFETGAPKLPFGPGVGCPDFNTSASWSFAVRVFGGPGTIFQEYTSTAQTAAYANLRDSIETKQLSVHGGLRFEAVNDLGLFLRAGADYQMYRSNNKFLGVPDIRLVTDSIFMEDTQTWRVETSRMTFQEQRTVYTRHHAVVLTAGIGFRKTFGNVSPYIMAEAGYELLFKKKGIFVLPDGNTVDLAEDEQGLYINDRPGFQYGGVIGVDFALTDRIEVGLSGHYKQLGGLRGSADLLDFDQSTAFGALNLRYTIH